MCAKEYLSPKPRETGRVRLPLHDPLAEARREATQGRPDQALAILDALLAEDAAGPEAPTGGKLEMAVALKCRCLIDQKRHVACRRFLDGVIGRGWIASDRPAVQIADMHLLLFAEEYAAVQNGTTSLLAEITDQADPRHAELRLLLGAALRWQGELSEALVQVEFAHAAFTVLGDPARAAVAANFMGWTQLSAGRLDEARRWFEKSLAVHEELGCELRMAQTYQNLAIVCYKQGDYALSEELLRRELKLVTDHPDMICRAHIALGNVLRLQGAPLPARSSLLEAYSLATERDLVREQVLSLEFLGDVLRDEGNPAEARRYYQRAMGLARTLAPRGDLVMELKRRQGECLDREGSHVEAQAVLTEALEIGNAVNDRFEIAAIRRCLGVNAAHLGRWQLACDHLGASLAELREMRARHEALLSAYHLATILVRRIDAGQAGSTAAAQLLETAWLTALQAQQWGQELSATDVGVNIGELIEDIVRRRSRRKDILPCPPAFTSRSVPATRVVAVSDAFRRILQRCDGFSRYKNPVMLEGESGTGKHLLARRIHETSPRGSRPLVQVNCASSSPEALAREIFGTAPGGAPHVRRNMPGLLVQAEGGAILLHGVEDLPRELQGRLLRLIQEGVYRPVGDGREHMANVRILATCETDLARQTDQGFFRQDLYFRLKQMHVVVPPLRDRSEAIVLLLDHFLARLGGAVHHAREVLDLQGLEALVEHRWPGNAAELETVAQQIWLYREQGRPFRLRLRHTALGGTLELIGAEARAASAEGDHHSGMTWTSINALIRRAGGNKAQVARNLGISRVTLYRWLEQLSPE
ncbi:hypothetical protein COW53_08780 [bacterium CG17_big_fil_post_rev_8_21_14_2_50_64_8]|nr:MAG: hypothetical protein COW53_08780 [bacterium CG17_big_fil_post_rev_8_21_14_2_50_64_8]PJA76536.1 MAG: hypothetical protein CO151_02300 [bacterium CG_4_9_14_3_um_filter_65_15]